MAEADFMRRAIMLARSQVGRTGDNPAVGCVVVREGRIVGEGATGDGGRPHAEEIALARAGEQAHASTLYVTLEPCAERSAGGTSCSALIAEAGVARVVIACPDPSAFAAGRGAERLRDAGIDLAQGLSADEAAGLYVGYSPAKSLERRR